MAGDQNAVAQRQVDHRGNGQANEQADDRAHHDANFWADYCAAVRLDPATPHAVGCFGDSPATADAGLDQVLHGAKRAIASLAKDRLNGPVRAAVPGGYRVITRDDGMPAAIVRTTWVTTTPLSAVDAAFARDDGAGEGDLALASWREAHLAAFARECATGGVVMPADPGVNLERFELMYPFAQAMRPVEPRLLPGYVPGGLADSAALQTLYYAQQHGFGTVFESGRLAGMAEFLHRYDPTQDGIWLVVHGGRVQGSVVIDCGGRTDGTAQLRWFILSEALRGQGFGRRLIDTAMTFCRSRRLQVFLTTFAGLDAARHLYEAVGFALIDERVDSTWGVPRREQRWQWSPTGAPHDGQRAQQGR